MDSDSALRIPHSALTWSLRSTSLSFEYGPAIMGIVNVTPDSFSDGGKYGSTEAAIGHALQLIKDGADILDIGGESTRPYSDPVATTEELDRVLPVIEGLVKRMSDPAIRTVSLSIDTSKADCRSGRNRCRRGDH